LNRIVFSQGSHGREERIGNWFDHGRSQQPSGRGEREQQMTGPWKLVKRASKPNKKITIASQHLPVDSLPIYNVCGPE
jgi:hypothetical protein